MFSRPSFSLTWSVSGSTPRQQATSDGGRSWSATTSVSRTASREVGRHRGSVIKTTGDGILASFDGPARAVRAGISLRDAAPSYLVLKLRVGVHTGECEAMGDDLGGIGVHIAARVQAAADPGEVLVSSTVKDLVVGSGLRSADRGERTLKGLPEPWRLHAAIADESAARKHRREGYTRAHAGCWKRRTLQHRG